MMMEVIAANPGIKYVDQPLSRYTASPYQLSRLPKISGSYLVAPTDPELALLHSFVDEILSGKIHVREPWRFWKSDFWFRSNRIVLKLTNGHGVCDWLTRQFHLGAIIVCRHPIAQALSVIRNGWGNELADFLADRRFCESYLTNAQLDYAHGTLRRGSLLEKHVLDWCLETVMLLHAMKNNSGAYFVSYEEFVQEPADVIQDWADLFSLPAISAMNGVSRRPSLSTRRSSTQSTKAAIRESDRSELLDRWRSEIDKSTERIVMRSLEVFEIGLYEPGSSVCTRRRGQTV